jgi:AAA15 family ATPase/GTPase
MIAAQNLDKEHHIVKKSEEEFGLLKTTLVYGANASGKSNLIKAMAFAKDLITNGVEEDKNVPIKKFKLDSSCYKNPSRFEFEFRYKNLQYAYGFSVDKTKVHEEWLYEIGYDIEKPIFERNEEGIAFNFGHNIYKNINDDEKQRLRYEAKGTGKKLLFLRNCQTRNIPYFNDIYEWFDNVLIIIFPSSKLGSLAGYMKTDTDFKKRFEDILNLFNLGIKKIEFIEEKLEEVAEIPQEIKEDIIQEFPHGENVSLVLGTKDFIYTIQENDLGELIVLRLTIVKDGSNIKNVMFKTWEESNGTRRIMDLIPMLISFTQKTSVFIIDEVERSLHTLLIRKLFDLILNHETFEKSESQLIASTHEVNLLDVKKLFRKDEIWFVEKDKSGASHLYSLAKTDLDDLDLRKGYLNGRFGAIPFIKDVRELGWEE